MGWCAKRRDFGPLTFIDLRDRDGLTQIVCNEEKAREAHAKAKELRGEYVLAVTGQVVLRDPMARNPKLSTGDIEVQATEVVILNDARTLPFQLDAPASEALASEDLRLKYRYLDLRRPQLQANLRLRHRLTGVPDRPRVTRRHVRNRAARRAGPEQRIAHGIQEAAGLGLLGRVPRLQLLDACMSALQRFVLQQHGLHQRIDGIGCLALTLRDGVSRIGIAWRTLYAGKPVKKLVNQLAFLGCHGSPPGGPFGKRGGNVRELYVAASAPSD